MKWIKKDNNREPWEDQKTNQPKGLSDKWPTIFAAVGICAIIVASAIMIWATATGKWAELAAKEATTGVRVDGPNFTAYAANTSQDTLQTNLELYGEDPSLMTLQLFHLTEVYDAEGQKVEVGSLSTLPEGHLYADENQQNQYVYCGGGVFVVTPDGKIQGKYSKPAQLGGVQVRALTNTGKGYLVENQHYSFERISERQSCALLHFAEEKSGKAVAEDFMVFFDAGDYIEIIYPVVDGLETLALGCRSGVAFELTVEYYEPEDVYKRAPDTTSIDPACICTDVQPDGYPVVDPTAVTVTNEDSTSEVLKGQTFDGVYKDGKDPE